MRYLKVIVLVLLSFLEIGCILVPAIDSVKRLGVTAGDRERLLNQEIKKFQEVLFWGNPQEVMAFASEEAQPSLREYLKQFGHDQRVVESKVKSIDFADDSYSANVEVGIKYYRVPFYMVNERFENQKWKFSMAGGWKLVSLQLTP